MPGVKAGDHVKVIYEGEVVSSPLAGESFRIRDMSGRTSTHRDVAPSFVKIEVLEPAYEHGQIYQAADGQVYKRWSDRWHNFHGCSLPHAEPKRPLTKLVPEGDN